MIALYEDLKCKIEAMEKKYDKQFQIHFNYPDKIESLGKSKFARIIHQIDQRCHDVSPSASDGLGGKPGLPDKKRL